MVSDCERAGDRYVNEEVFKVLPVVDFYITRFPAVHLSSSMFISNVVPCVFEGFADYVSYLVVP